MWWLDWICLVFIVPLRVVRLGAVDLEASVSGRDRQDRDARHAGMPERALPTARICVIPVTSRRGGSAKCGRTSLDDRAG